MDIKNSVAVVTGANRGLGRHFAAQLLERGGKVYAGARSLDSVDLPGAIPLRIDITDPASVERAAKIAGDATVLINNAGTSLGQPLIGGDLDLIRQEMETHYFGTLGVTRAFVPVLEANGGGAILNVLSVLSWFHPAQAGAYSAAKAAGWAMTRAVRDELAQRGIEVAALHVGYMDTDMAAGIPAEQKTDPAVVARLALDGIAEGRAEILADDVTRSVKAGLVG
ncbi:SDR family oxidoreductase [Paractinoplanes ferrugineus]|uniref:Short-chain dehydrogenase n=1 Tax=Paractinoplanes ferrugineus TaxID=113564 RepID=A0A919MK60_9ACTN|nr:SDR family oxidoreductase [Actinoplanes ferrugineus]GIE10862.1 short-chain dehydrogenase [Actinoplanes ferrugineus]